MAVDLGGVFGDWLNFQTGGASGYIGDRLGVDWLKPSKIDLGEGPGQTIVENIPGVRTIVSGSRLAAEAIPGAYTAWTGKPFQRGGGDATTAPTTSINDFINSFQRSPQTSTADLIRSRREQLYGAPPAPSVNMGALAGQLNANEMAALQNYWQNLQQFGANRAQALNQMFSGLSAATARQGAATERQGTQLAADIEALYSNLGADMGDIAAGSYAGPSPTAGLAPVSGAMATAPIETSAAGSNLASFLESAAGAQAQNVYDIAGAQARQGAATSQGFLDTLAMAEAQARIAQQQRAAERAFQAQLADQQARDAAAQQRFAADREFEQALLLAEQQDLQRMAGPQEGDTARMYMATLDEKERRKFMEDARRQGFTTARDLDLFANARLGAGL